MKRIVVELNKEVWGPDGEPVLDSWYVCGKCYPKVVLVLDIIRKEEVKDGRRHICHICTEKEVGNATQK